MNEVTNRLDELPGSRAALDGLLASLTEEIGSHGSVLVAFSGGVDSALVAAVAHRALGARSVAATAVAETLSARDLEIASAVARSIGIRHEIVEHRELDNPEFVANPSHRCYVCQGMRMDLMRACARDWDFDVVCDGTNASDPGPDRPGLEAIRERGVSSPLLKTGVDKQTTRALARHLGLEVWNRPSNACLSSRIPHGQVVTLGGLKRIERAEDYLEDRGFRVVRVRADRRSARIEVGAEEVARLQQLWGDVEPDVLAMGFESATIDPNGYRSGGANRVE